MTTSEVVVQRTAGDSRFTQNIFEIEIDGATALKFLNAITNESLDSRHAVGVLARLPDFLTHCFILPQTALVNYLD